MLSQVNTVAGKWAEDRAAELVGMRRLPSGKLITNPDVRFAIDQVTRDHVREIVTQAFEDGSTIDELAERIRSSDAFSQDRAEMIAVTEAARASTQGNLHAWRETGLVKESSVILSADHDSDDECDDAAEGGPYSLDDAPDLPIHPRCTCSLRIESLASGDGDDEEDEE